MQKARSGAGKPGHRTRSPIETGCPEGKCRPPDGGGLTLEGVRRQGVGDAAYIAFRLQAHRWYRLGRDAYFLGGASRPE